MYSGNRTIVKILNQMKVDLLKIVKKKGKKINENNKKISMYATNFNNNILLMKQIYIQKEN